MLIDQANLPLDKPLMSLSACSIQGKRNHMEDYFDIGYQMKPCDQQRPNEWPYEYFYFGIFDGHGGSEAASFAKKNLLKFITQQKDFWSNDDQDVMRAIRQGFSETHLAMRREMSAWSRTSRILPSTAGTTASVLFIKNGKFYSGHVGDSRIVICQENPETKNWISRQITEDHKPESKQETDRIKRAGGEVRSKVGVYRVVWKRPVLTSDIENKLILDLRTDSCDNMEMVSSYPVNESLVDSYQTIPFLAIARSLGDFWSLNPYSGQYTVSPEPDIECRPITSNDKGILLATDGLWNVINSSYAVKLLQELDILKGGRRPCNDKLYYASDNFYDVAGAESENHAQSLVYFAYQNWERRRLRSDNITVVVAMLHDIFAHFQKLNHPYSTRASATSDKENIVRHLPNTELVQLGQTNSFFERVLLNREPLFDICNTPQRTNDEKWQKLESFLILPPTLLEQECDFATPKIGYPKNYLRLSHAACRRIIRPDCSSDNYIYIKHVSDDPADEELLPTRISKSGKQVRDASAQATQTIHDFGQPWDQLIDANEEYPHNKSSGTLRKDIFDADSSTENEDTGADKAGEERDYDIELVFADELEGSVVVEEDESDDDDDDEDDDDEDDDDDDEDDDDDTELVFAHELENDRDETSELVYGSQFESDNQNDGDDEEDSDEEDNDVESPETYRRSRSRSSSSAARGSSVEDKSSIPQLRCLLNYTPPLRRSSRNSGYLSVSDNAKRKSQLSSSMSRSKRRKSQPIPRALSRPLNREH